LVGGCACVCACMSVCVFVDFGGWMRGRCSVRVLMCVCVFFGVYA